MRMNDHINAKIGDERKLWLLQEASRRGKEIDRPVSQTTVLMDLIDEARERQRVLHPDLFM